jgi:hypothetical protein
MEAFYTNKQRTVEIDFKDKIKIWCFGDIHRFTKSCDDERWKWFLKRAKDSQDDNTYYIGLGDYCDFASTKERKAILGGLHEQTIDDFDLIVQKRNRVLAAEMSFMKGRVLGLIEGNHTWRFKTGRTSTEDLCDRLETEYLGWLTHFSLRVKFKNHSNAVYVYIVACHGKSGGKTAGNTVNQVDDLRAIFPVADIYIEGHDHQRMARPMSVIIPSFARLTNEVKLKQKRQFLCRAGSFKKAYMPDSTSYEVGRLLKPADLGALLLNVSFHRDRNDGDVMITDIVAEV